LRTDQLQAAGYGALSRFAIANPYPGEHMNKDQIKGTLKDAACKVQEAMPGR